MHIYDNVRGLCIKKGISISYVEKEAGISNGSIRKWNESSPTAANLKAVADVLHVKVDKLLE